MENWIFRKLISGTYVLYSEGDRPTYIHKTNLVQTFLHHTQDSTHNWSGWQFTRDISDVFGFIGLEVDDQCPSGAKNKPWQYHLNGQWFDDETLTVTCNGEGPTTTSGPMPTTSGGSGGDTTKPNPVGFQRTIIFVEKVVQPWKCIKLLYWRGGKEKSLVGFSFFTLWLLGL